VKNGIFGDLYAKKFVKPLVFLCFRRVFRVAWKAYLTSMNLSSTTPGPGTPPVNSRRTKQFWSRRHSL
jgi:hypothetical protein